MTVGQFRASAPLGSVFIARSPWSDTPTPYMIIKDNRTIRIQDRTLVLNLASMRVGHTASDNFSAYKVLEMYPSLRSLMNSDHACLVDTL